MRVLHMLWDGDLGDVQRYVLKLTAAPGWGDVAHGLCFFTHGGQVMEEETIRMPVWELDLRRGWDVWRMRRFAKTLQRFAPDVIHCHCNTPLFFSRLGAYKKYRLVYTEHGDTLIRSDHGWLTRWLWKHRGLHWDAALMHSADVRDDFLRRYPWIEPVTQLVPNPVHTHTAFDLPAHVEQLRQIYQPVANSMSKCASRTDAGFTVDDNERPIF